MNSCTTLLHSCVLYAFTHCIYISPGEVTWPDWAPTCGLLCATKQESLVLVVHEFHALHARARAISVPLVPPSCIVCVVMHMSLLDAMCALKYIQTLCETFPLLLILNEVYVYYTSSIGGVTAYFLENPWGTTSGPCLSAWWTSVI